MSFPHEGADQIWRDGTDEAHHPKKPHIRDWGRDVEGRLVSLEAAATGTARYIRNVVADLTLIATVAEGDTAYVLKDPVAPGTYEYIAGNWEKVADLPTSLSALEVLQQEFDGGLLSHADREKLSGVDQRANHTGEQAIGTITGLQDALDSKALDGVSGPGAGFLVPIIGFAGQVFRRTAWLASGGMLYGDGSGGQRQSASRRSYAVPVIATLAAATFTEAGAVVSGKDDNGDMRSAGFRVPQIADMRAASFGLDGSVLRADRENTFVVPAIGQISDACFAYDGAMVEARTAWGDLRMGPFAVPQIGGFVAAEFYGSGNLAKGMSAANAAADVGQVTQRPSFGAITGRVVDQLWVRRSEATYVAVTAGPDAVELEAVDAANGIAQVWRDGRLDDVKWRTAPLGNGETLHLTLVMGQSLAQGYTDNGLTEKVPAWRDPVHERAWQFKAADGIARGPRPFQVAPDYVNRNTEVTAAQLAQIEPLAGANHAYSSKYAQTSLETTAAALLGQHLDHRDHVLAATVGTGSTPIADFEPGSEHYASAVAVIDAAAAKAEAMGLTLKVWVIWNQGEQDNIDGTTDTAWKAAWLGIRDGLAAHTTGTAGGLFGGALIQQTGQRPGGVTGMATLAQADLITAGEAMGVPVYPMRPGHSGNAHLYPATYLPLGAGCAAAIAQTVADGALAAPPHVATGGAALVDDFTIDCVFSGGVGALRFDVKTFPDGGTKGVRVSDDSGPVAVASVDWAADKTLRITLADATDLLLNPVVSFGLDGPEGLDGSDFARVNIRDGSGWPCPVTGQITSGWAIQHTVSVTA